VSKNLAILGLRCSWEIGQVGSGQENRKFRAKNCSGGIPIAGLDWQFQLESRGKQIFFFF